MEFINVELVPEMLAVGSVGFVGGVLIPWGFRLIGYVVDIVKTIVG